METTGNSDVRSRGRSTHPQTVSSNGPQTIVQPFQSAYLHGVDAAIHNIYDMTGNQSQFLSQNYNVDSFGATQYGIQPPGLIQLPNQHYYGHAQWIHDQPYIEPYQPIYEQNNISPSFRLISHGGIAGQTAPFSELAFEPSVAPAAQPIISHTLHAEHPGYVGVSQVVDAPLLSFKPTSPSQWLPHAPATLTDQTTSREMTGHSYTVPDIISARPINQAPPASSHRALLQSDRVSRVARHGSERQTLLKTSQGMKPRRRGPLDARTRDKVGEMRDMNACWRCRKYKKPCNGPGVCNSCLIPRFKVWPSAIGCRREILESMVQFLLPTQLEESLALLPGDLGKRGTWRALTNDHISLPRRSDALAARNIWEQSQRELMATGYFGQDYLDLADLAMKYQNSLPKPHKCLEASCELLLATCAWYRCIVHVPSTPTPSATIVECGTAVRTATRRAFALLQQTCLSTKRTDWLPAFLSALITTIAAVYFMDTVMLMPEQARRHIWPDISNTRNDLRSKVYVLLLDLLRASTKGINPLTLDCWALPQTGDPSKNADRTKDKEREILLGSEAAAIDGLLGLKAWHATYQHHLLEGKAMFANDLVGQAKIKPIAGSWKIFEI